MLHLDRDTRGERFARRRTFFLIAVALIWAMLTAAYLYRHDLSGTVRPGNVPGYLLIVTFLVGIAAYLYRDRIPARRSLCALAVGLTAILLEFPVFGDALVPLPIAYVTVYLGLSNAPKASLLKGADYSYGVFLYGYAVQQAWMTLGPAVHHWYINIALTLPTVAAIAAVSWHFIEKPALGGRAIVKWYERRFGREIPWDPLSLLIARLRPPLRVDPSAGNRCP